MQDLVEGGGFGGGEVGCQVGHAVGAAAQADVAFAGGGGAAGADAGGVVVGDDAVEGGQDGVAAGAGAGGDGGHKPVDDLALDGAAVGGVDGAHVAGEQGGGVLVEAAGFHGLDQGGEAGDQGAGPGEQGAGAVVVHAVGGDDLGAGDVEGVDDGVLGSQVDLGVVAGGQVAPFLLVLAHGVKVVAGAQAGGGGDVLGRTGPARRRRRPRRWRDSRRSRLGAAVVLASSVTAPSCVGVIAARPDDYRSCVRSSEH
ncbi:hypothetical protein KHA85_14935 [Dietzia sp. Marseille-Q0999]|nr:hypothetical protein [Dietzia massiliensis]MBS7549346.1 hypothetical protein [Dietzia massiliensis]